MPKVYRSMRASGEFPEVGRSAACLGVRPEDIPIGGGGYSRPNTGGMSVAPSWRLLAPWRIPRRLNNSGALKATESNSLRCWTMGLGSFESGEIAAGLRLRVDGARHGMIEPALRVPFALYEELLEATRMNWVIDEA